MSKLSVNYIAVQEGKMSRTEFVRQAKMMYPTVISQFSSYPDTVKILRNRGMLSEAVVQQCLGDKFPLESIKRGIDYELFEMGYHVASERVRPAPGDYKEARKKVIQNLAKNPLYYVEKLAKGEKGAVLTEARRVAAPKEKAAPRISKREQMILTKWTPEKLMVGYVVYNFGVKGINALVDKFGATMDKALKYKVGQVSSQRSRTEVKDVLTDIATALCGSTYSAFYTYTVKRFNEDSYLTKNSATGEMDKRYRGILTKYEGVDLANVIKDIDITPEQIEKNVEEATLKNKEIQKRQAERGVRRGKEAQKATNNAVSTVNAILDMVRSMTKDPEKRLQKFEQFYRQKVQKDPSLMGADVGSFQPDIVAIINKVTKEVRGKKNLQESKEMKLLREEVTKTIVKVLKEAATSNLAQLSDENASIQSMPGIINTLENIVTEIESFINKEQIKIQGVFDSLGNIKNEDGIPIGHQFAERILESFGKDLAPVMEKADFVGNITMPTAPEITVPGAENLNTAPEGEEIEDKETVFSPKKDNLKGKTLQESKTLKRRYTA